MKTLHALATAGLVALAGCGGGSANNGSGNSGNNAAPTGDLNASTPSTLPPVDTSGADIVVDTNLSAGNTAGATTNTATK